MSFSTTDIPKAAAFTLLSMAVSGWLEPCQHSAQPARACGRHVLR